MPYRVGYLARLPAFVQIMDPRREEIETGHIDMLRIVRQNIQKRRKPGSRDVTAEQPEILHEFI